MLWAGSYGIAGSWIGRLGGWGEVKGKVRVGGF